MRLDTPEFHAILTPELQTLAELFEKYGFKDEIRIVGGAVRDLLDGKKPHDLDFATVATPQQMKDMFQKEGIRMINEKGEKHGTITARVNNKENFEITTLRNDVSTDGRHAVVEFTKDWVTDAARRDLTINSMYLDLQGNLFDYFNGYEDLKNRKVVFVGDPDDRIKEDYLRILRYFRFFGRIVKNPLIHDERTLDGIRKNASGLERISGERIWSELNRILTGNFANEIMKKILELGLAPYIGLRHPDDLDMLCFDNVCSNVSKYSFKPITFIAVLLKTEDEVLTLHNRLKFSSFERDLAIYFVNHKNDKLPLTLKDRLRHFQRSLIFSKVDRGLTRAFMIELLKVLDEEDVIKSFEPWTIPELPVSGTDLKKQGLNGKTIGNVLKELREVWINNDFVLNDNLVTDVVSRCKIETNTSK